MTVASNKKSNRSTKPAVKSLAPRNDAKVKAGIPRKGGGGQHEYLTVTQTDVF